jgi:hypothetical protein
VNILKVLALIVLFQSNNLLLADAKANNHQSSYQFISDSLHPTTVEKPPLPSVIEITKVPVVEVKAIKIDEGDEDYLSKEWWAVYISAALTLLTMALAVYTGLLWRSTNQVVLDTREATQMQLRAYVSIMHANFSPHRRHKDAEVPDNEFPAYFDIGIKNWGQTPAHELSVNINFHSVAINESLPEDFDYPDKVRDLGPGQLRRKRGVIVIAPGNAVTNTLALNESELQSIQSSLDHQINLYIYGWVRYKDIFGISRESQFCYLVGHFAHGNFSPLTHYHEHNVET